MHKLTQKVNYNDMVSKKCMWIKDIVNYRTLVKSAQQKNNFLNTQPKHMLWVH